MNTIKKYINVLLAAATVAVGFSSCENLDYPDRFRATDGVPTIYGVRYVNTGVYTEQAFMEEAVCILGENLTSVNRLFFNDQEAILNSSYITDKTLLVNVPKTMAKVETDMIYFVTAAKDTVTYKFSVLPPAPRVKEMAFEYAPAGTEVSIYGDYFYEKPGKDIEVTFAGAAVPHSDIRIANVNEIVVKVPEGAQPGRVKVTTPSGIGQSPFWYNDNRGLLFDFDGTNGLYTSNTGWHPADVVDGGVTGKCLTLVPGKELAVDGSEWVDGKGHFEYWAGQYQDPEQYGTWGERRLIDIVDFSDFINMCIKFEVKIPAESPWKGCPMQIIFAGVNLVSNSKAGVKDIYGVTVGGQNNTYFNDKTISLPRYLWRPWESTGSFDTNGEWRTITIPFSEFTKFFDGTNATGKLTKESFSCLEFFLAGGTSSEGTASNPVFFIDNIRAVPVK